MRGAARFGKILLGFLFALFLCGHEEHGKDSLNVRTAHEFGSLASQPFQQNLLGRLEVGIRELGRINVVVVFFLRYMVTVIIFLVIIIVVVVNRCLLLVAVHGFLFHSGRRRFGSLQCCCIFGPLLFL